MELVRTKLEAPPASGDLIDRPRLAARLTEADHAHVVLVQAPAGYGKTTALVQWHAAVQQAGRTAAWLAIDESDQEGVGLLLYIGAAIARPGAFEGVAASYPCPTTDSLLAFVVDAVAGRSEPVTLFIDDVQLLGLDAARTLTRLIERAPATLRFVLSSRSTPDLHLARARARGALLELGIDDLRFTHAETAAFMQRCGATLTDADLILLDERAEGWIAGLKLLSLAMRGGMSADDALSALSGSQRCVADFFAEEVFASQTEEIRQFLLRTSVLNRFSTELCEHLTGATGAAQTLAHIEKAGLFLLPLDEQRTWFRYHHLFAEFLQRRLREEFPGLERTLHLQASEWCWTDGLHAEAIEHAFRGGDPQRAANLLEVRCQDMTYTGKLPLVRKFSAQLPEAVLQRCPRLMLAVAWLLTRNLRFEETKTLLTTVRSRIEEMRTDPVANQQEIRTLEYLTLHREMMLAAAHDQPAEVEQRCRQLLEDYPEERHPYLSGTIYSQLLFARREQYSLNDLERLASTAHGILQRSPYRFASVALEATVGPSLFFAGKTDAAIAALERGLAEATRYGGINSDVAALTALPLAEVLYETNQLARAEDLVQNTLPYATEMGFVDQLLAGFVTRARICRARADRAGAARALEQAAIIAIERKLDRLHFAIIEERVRTLIQDGQSDDAARYLDEVGVARAVEAHFPRGGVTTVHEYRAIAWVRVAQSEGQNADALHVARQWRTFCASHGAVRSLVRWNILLAQILFVAGDVRAAQRALREAISHAAPARLMRSFIDEGAVIRSLLASTYEGELEVLHPTDAFAAELLEAVDTTGAERTSFRLAVRPSEGLYGKLSPKEREILSLVSSGMRNREVAKTLGMTEGSVKWYMQQVYDKVGTRRRLQAVERARQFGLIA